MEDVPDGVLVITQSRSNGAAAMAAGAAMMAAGWWLMQTTPGRTEPWLVAAAIFVAGAVFGGSGLVGALRPPRLVISADGVDVSQLIGARTVAWEELAAIGQRKGRHKDPQGVRLLLRDQTSVDLAANWPMSPEQLVATLNLAWGRARAHYG